MAILQSDRGRRIGTGQAGRIAGVGTQLAAGGNQSAQRGHRRAGRPKDTGTACIRWHRRPAAHRHAGRGSRCPCRPARCSKCSRRADRLPRRRIAPSPAAGAGRCDDAPRAESTAAPEPELTTEQQMDLIRQRIEARRAQLRQQERSSTAAPTGQDKVECRHEVTFDPRFPAGRPAGRLRQRAGAGRAPRGRRHAASATGAAGTGAQTSPLNSVEEPETGPQAVIRRGTGQVINRSAASAPPPSLSGQQRRGHLQFRRRVGARGGQGDPRRHARPELRDRARRAGHGDAGHAQAGRPGARR